MARSIQRPPRQGGPGRVVAAVTLAWWQFRLTWRLLLIAGAGVVGAVILVCTVPLYSQVALSAGLRAALNTPGDSSVTIHSVAHLISQPATEKIAEQIQQEVEQDIGPFLAGSQFSAQSSALSLGQDKLLQLIGWSMSDASAHVDLLAGHLPQNGGKVLEIALMPQTARDLNLQVGATFSLSLPFLDGLDNQILFPLPLRVSGIFQPEVPGENFWHGAGFAPQALGPYGTLYPALVSNNSYLTALAAASLSVSHSNPLNGISFENPTDFYWYYNLDLAHLDINHLDDLSTGLNNVLVNISDQPVAQPYVDKTTSSGPSDLLNGYSDRVAVARIPLLSLTYLIAGLLLFFVSLVSSLLVDQQAEAIALWRSRGASREQVFSALLAQSVGIGMIAFVVGPLLSLFAARLLVQISLPAIDQGALNVMLEDPFSAVLRLCLTSLAAVGVSILAMCFALYRASRLDVLVPGQSTAPDARGPIWMRVGLNVLAGILALLGYALSAYIAGPGVLDARTRVLILPPLTLVGAVFLLFGCMLLFLRILPVVLEGCARLAARARGAVSLLAMAQMAHAPRQSLRMTLLLALAVAFGIFSLVFGSSQTQRIPIVAAYQVGADFSGTYPQGAGLSREPLAQQEAAFAHIPGVHTACVGYTSATRGAQSGVNAPIELRAVDARAFASTAIWTEQDSSQPLSSLMQRLIEQRNAAIGAQVVPAIVDQAAWKTLSLAPGSSFTLSDLNGTVSYVEVAEVDHIPTVNDSPYASGTNDYVALGGVLVDFTTYQAVLQQVAQTSTPLVPTTVWLHTKTDATSLASARTALAAGPLHLLNVNDLRTQEELMGNDPLSLALLGVLMIGTLTALLLSVAGNLLLSWLSTHSRRVNFAVMRALGTAPGQLAGVLTYEQVIVYATALGLGISFGIVLSYLVLPTFVFTAPVGNAGAGTGVFYITQSVPPIQTIIPGVLIALIIGVLVAVCIVIVGIMVRSASRPALGNILRLPGD
ncbi:MAG TPA: FtsX-like permease family protein [Ktedonobacteraceae bacterium]|nr:FtsX-like permease family protein [Ktedonobacteraceae bacterium]